MLDTCAPACVEIYETQRRLTAHNLWPGFGVADCSPRTHAREAWPYANLQTAYNCVY